MWEALALTAALCQVLRNTVMKRLGHELDGQRREEAKRDEGHPVARYGHEIPP